MSIRSKTSFWFKSACGLIYQLFNLTLEYKYYNYHNKWRNTTCSGKNFHCSSCLHRHRNSQHFGLVLSFAHPSCLPFTYIYIKFMLGILDYGYSSLVLRYSCIHITILIVIYQFILVWLFGHLERSPGFFSGPCEARVGHIYFLAPPASFFQLWSQGFNRCYHT